LEIAMGKFAAAETIAMEPSVEEAANDRAIVPAIDLVHLSRQTLGDSALEAELLILFDRQALQLAGRLAPAVKSGEANWRADLAHTLKGSARAVGAFQVGDAAEAYEIAVRAEAPDLELAFKRLHAAVDRARKEIAALL
jgi:HPt (histidine-containing phosphotransfer) domain-containing protein